MPRPDNTHPATDVLDEAADGFRRMAELHNVPMTHTSSLVLAADYLTAGDIATTIERMLLDIIAGHTGPEARAGVVDRYAAMTLVRLIREGMTRDVLDVIAYGGTLEAAGR